MYELRGYGDDSQTAKPRLFYGFKESEKLTDGIFVEQQNKTANEKVSLKFFNPSKSLEIFVARELEKFRENNLIVFESNDKTLDFVGDMFSFFINMGYFEFNSRIGLYLPFLTLNRQHTTFKLIIMNLFILAHLFEHLEEEILKTIIGQIVNVDNEGVPNNKTHFISNKKYKSDVDFLMRMLITYMKINDNNGELSRRKSKDVYTDYYIDFVRKNPKKKTQKNFEKIMSFVINCFFENTLKVESPSFVQFLVPLICQLKSKPTLKPEFNSYSDYFFKVLFQKIISKQTQVCLKERLLVYLYSYIKFAKLDSHFVSDVVFYLQQLLNLITKTIVKKLKSEFPEIEFEKNKELGQTVISKILKAFETPLFSKLLVYISAILNENLELISTHAKIDIINGFECYFNRFLKVLRILLTKNAAAKEVFIKLNKFLRISKLFEFDEDCLLEKPISLTGSPSPKRNYLSSTYCSMTSLSCFSIVGFEERGIIKEIEGTDNVWKESTLKLPFGKNEFSFLKEFENKYARGVFVSKNEVESFERFEDSLDLSANSSKKNSFSESDFGSFVSGKRVKLD